MASTPSAPDQVLSASQSSANKEGETLSPLEQEILDEYARLVGNLNNLSSLLAGLAENPSAEILDGLRRLERKTSLVFTLLKSSVYSIVMQQQDFEEGGGAGSSAVDSEG